MSKLLDLLGAVALLLGSALVAAVAILLPHDTPGELRRLLLVVGVVIAVELAIYAAVVFGRPYIDRGARKRSQRERDESLLESGHAVLDSLALITLPVVRANAAVAEKARTGEDAFEAGEAYVAARLKSELEYNRDFRERVTRVFHRLRARGIEPGTKVTNAMKVGGKYEDILSIQYALADALHHLDERTRYSEY